jgi:hypothetical protein
MDAQEKDQTQDQQAHRDSRQGDRGHRSRNGAMLGKKRRAVLLTASCQHDAPMAAPRVCFAGRPVLRSAHP